jgi:hypothetical protein
MLFKLVVAENAKISICANPFGRLTPLKLVSFINVLLPKSVNVLGK